MPHNAATCGQHTWSLHFAGNEGTTAPLNRLAIYTVSVVSATLYCSSALPRHTRLGPCRHPRPGLHTPDSIDVRSDVGAGAVLHGTSRLLPHRPRCGSPSPGRAPSRYCMPTLYGSSTPRRSVRSGALAKFQVTHATGAPPLCALERAPAYIRPSLPGALPASHALRY